MRRPNLPKVMGGGGRGAVRNVLIHCPTHPLPLISLPEFYSPLLLGWKQRGQGAGYRGLQEASVANQLLQEAPGSLHTPRQFALSCLPAWSWGEPSREGEEL